MDPETGKPRTHFEKFDSTKPIHFQNLDPERVKSEVISMKNYLMENEHKSFNELDAHCRITWSYLCEKCKSCYFSLLSQKKNFNVELYFKMLELIKKTITKEISGEEAGKTMAKELNVYLPQNYHFEEKTEEKK